MRLAKIHLAAATLLFSFAASAFASDADFQLVNKTGYQVDNVYVSPNNSENWGKDILGRGALADGESVNITFPHTSSACKFDIKVTYHDDNTSAEWAGVDLCKYEKISIFWDGKQTRAEGE